MKSAVILISGRGSNMQALIEAKPGLEFRAVISNRPAAKGLAWAAARGIETRVVDHKAFPSRDSFDDALAQAVDAFAPDYIFLAGFMRILTRGFIDRYPRSILNIHPSILPAFTGLDTHRRAIDAGVKLHGATVHFVTPALDHGPILVQAAVPVLASDTTDTLAERVLAQEHRIYPQAARWLAEGRVEFRPMVEERADRDMVEERADRDMVEERADRDMVEERADSNKYVVQVRGSGVTTDWTTAPRDPP